jgi:hypothetical protein
MDKKLKDFAKILDLELAAVTYKYKITSMEPQNNSIQLGLLSQPDIQEILSYS